MRNFLSLAFLALAMPVTAAAAFRDVPDNYPYLSAVEYVQQQGIVSGYPNGTFKPDNPINRAEFTKIVMGSVATQENIRACMEGIVPATIGFPDVPSYEWFAPYICIAKEGGIIGGYPDGTFKPQKTINFAEAAKIIASAFSVPMTNDSTVWYKGYVVALAQRNAIPLSLSSYDHLLTRGEMAEIIWRLKAGVTNLPSKTYEDLTVSTPVINSVSGPTTIPVGETGTWTVIANPQSGLTFYEQLGAEASLVLLSATSGQPNVFQWSFVVAGNYTIKFIVQDAAGNSTEKSVTVHVTDSSSVLGQIEQWTPGIHWSAVQSEIYPDSIGVDGTLTVPARSVQAQVITVPQWNVARQLNQNLIQNGWSEDMYLAADGVTGSQWGYRKKEGNALRFLIFRENSSQCTANVSAPGVTCSYHETSVFYTSPVSGAY